MGAPDVSSLRVQPPVPFGEVTMLPACMTGRPEADMARAMAAALGDIDAPSAADVYNRLAPVITAGAARTRGVRTALWRQHGAARSA